MTHTAEYPPLAEPRGRRRRTKRQPTRVSTTPALTGAQLNTALLWALIIGAGAVALVAMAASSFTLAGLGKAIGWVQWNGRLAWSLPISADLLAAVAGVAWLAGGVSERARALARGITIAAVTVSVTLNAIGHLVESGDLLVKPWLRIAVSTVPPIVAAVALHLVVTVLREHTRATPAPTGRHPLPVEPPLAAPTTEAEPELLPLYEAPVFTPAERPVFTPAASVVTPEPQASTTTRSSELDPAPAPDPEPTRELEPEQVVTSVITEPTATEAEPSTNEDEVTTDARLDEDEAARVIEECWREGVSQREAARRATRVQSYVGRVYRRLDQQHQAQPMTSQIALEGLAA